MSAPLSLQFHHVPLYLEWAPIGVFHTAPKEQSQDTPAEPVEKECVQLETGKRRVRDRQAWAACSSGGGEGRLEWSPGH